MRRRLGLVRVGLTAALSAALSAAPAASAAGLRITVKPRSAAPTASFTIRLRAPAKTGPIAGIKRAYILSVSGPRGRAGCVANASENVPASNAGARVKLTLKPQRFGGVRWCPGAYHGKIEELQSPECPPGRLCPALVVLVGTIGKFGFHVRPPDGDAAPPEFSGLERALACTPGAQRPGQTTPFTLSWNAGRDSHTSASKLVYDVYMAVARGSENFVKPSWTSAPGATSFRTPGLASHGTFYFVVRARDRAGNEDGNTVERFGVDPCL